MITIPKGCLSDQELAEFGSGRAPNERFESMLAHLDSCELCQQRAEQALDQEDDPFIAQLGRPPETTSPECEIIAEPDCEAALFHAGKSSGARFDSLVPPIETLGPYRLLRRLGRGGMGAVYLAEHVRLQRKCAVKLLPRERCFDEDWLRRFEREMQAVASLEHPHIVTATDAGDADGWHFLVMEYLDGLDLAAVVRRVGPIPVDLACAIMRKVCEALEVIHQAGLVHRDIKPSNIMLTRDGAVKLLDLGLIVDVRQTAEDMRLTTIGHVIGTLAFAAPEQLSDGQSVDARADLYGVGATLFHLIAGHPAHGSENGIAPLVIEKTSKPAKELQDIDPSVPADVNQLVACLLDREPTSRPDDARAVIDQLDSAATTEALKRLARQAIQASDPEDSATASVRPPRPLAEGGENRSRTGRGKWMIALGGLAAIIAAVVFYIQTNRGTLVIHSDLPDLDVSVERDGEEVDALTVSPGENRTTLRSGTYAIVINSGSDQVRVSPEKVVVRRGDVTIVTIREQRAAENVAASTKQQLYKGTPIDHWVTVAQTERDVETLSEAMDAIVSLAEDSDVEAVSSIFISARRLGGWVSSSNRSNPSERYMQHYQQTFRRALPDPGIEAITRELAEGNANSRAACLWSLTIYDIRERQSPEMGLTVWAKDTRNHAKASALHNELHKLLRKAETLEPENSLPRTRELSLRIALAMGAPLREEPGLTSYLEQRARESEREDLTTRLDRYEQDIIRTGSPDARLEGEPLTPDEVIAAVRLGIDLPSSLTVRSLLSQSEQRRTERHVHYLARLADSPSTIADETLFILGSSIASSLVEANEAVLIKALPVIARETTRPQITSEILSAISDWANGRRVTGISQQFWDVVASSIELVNSRVPADVREELEFVGEKYLKYAQRIIDRYDKNKDGTLTESEYSKMLMSPEAADRNKDGIISVREYALFMESRTERGR